LNSSTYKILQYNYDHAGQRISSIHYDDAKGKVEEKYYYKQGQLSRVTDETGTEISKYIYNPSGDILLKEEKTSGTSKAYCSYLKDIRGSVKSLISETGKRLIGIREFAGIHTMVWSPDDGIVLCTNFDMNGFIYCNNESTKELMEQSAKKQSIYLNNLKEEYDIKDCITRHEFAKAAELVTGVNDDTLKVMMFNLYYDFGIEDEVNEFIEYMKKECEHVYWQEVHDLIMDNPY